MSGDFRVNTRQYVVDGPTSPRRTREERNGSVINGSFHPAAWECAMILAGEERKRVHVWPDGSGALVVVNDVHRPKWLKKMQRDARP